MGMTDRPAADPLGPSWLAFGHNLAVAAGALMALVSLFHHVPVWLSSLRGALVFLGIEIIVRVGHALLVRTRPRNVRRSGMPTRKDPS
jgi:hypothetical protein